MTINIGKKALLTLWVGCSVALLVGCSGTRPVDIGVINGQLTACPDSPNCVSSFESEDDQTHYITPYAINSPDPLTTWKRLESIVKQNQSAEIITLDGHYLYAEFTSDIMGFVDDTEFMLNTESNSIHLRSASRLGYRDFGVNRERLEAIRDELQQSEVNQ